MACDYYMVRRGYFDLKQLYSADKHGPYYGILGFSWIGYTSYLSGILINIVGFVGSVGIDVPIAAIYIYNLNYFTGFIVAFVVYYILARLFPIPATSPVWNEVSYHGTEMPSAAEKELDVEERQIEDVDDS